MLTRLAFTFTFACYAEYPAVGNVFPVAPDSSLGGDASTLLLKRTQDPSVAAMFQQDGVVGQIHSPDLIRGRAGYNHVGALRTKPARADAITTRSMSCSDKLASWSVLGVQGALLSKLLLEPIYVSRYVFGGVPVELADEIQQDCTRALFDRVESVSKSCEPSDQDTFCW